jgi:hypothetical protein
VESPVRNADRNDARRGSGISLETLIIASLASAAAAFAASRIWGTGTLISAAATPVVVALVSEFLRRPVQTVAATARKVPTVQTLPAVHKRTIGVRGLLVQKTGLSACELAEVQSLQRPVFAAADEFGEHLRGCVAEKTRIWRGGGHSVAGPVDPLSGERGTPAACEGRGVDVPWLSGSIDRLPRLLARQGRDARRFCLLGCDGW